MTSRIPSPSARPPIPRFQTAWRLVTLKVHVIDAAGQPADGVAVQADVSMSGMDQGAQHLTLDGKGGGDYEGDVKLEMAGSWDVDLTATQGDKSGKQKLSMEVGG